MLDVSLIETSGLGDRSYLVSDGDVAVAIDPQRDIDRVLELAGNLRITHVLETHIHNDYVTGGLALADAIGAQYVIPAGEDVEFSCRAVNEGDRIDTGAIHLEALLTPGHTHHHVSYVLRDDSGQTVGVFTGGSMLFGSTGRTDLSGAENTVELSRRQYHSVRRLADELPSETPVYPTHGFGSFCSAAPADGDNASTIGEQRAANPALTQDEQAYIDQLLAELAEFPAYYAHMGVINRAGPAAADLSPPGPVDPGELRRRIVAGEWVVDLRNRSAFAAGHLAGGAELRSYRVADFEDLASVLDDRGVVVLDVRQAYEFDGGHIRGAVSIALHELPERLTDIPADRELWIHCASGYRASVAAALLDRQARHVVLIDDDYDNAEKLGLTSSPTDTEHRSKQ